MCGVITYVIPSRAHSQIFPNAKVACTLQIKYLRVPEEILDVVKEQQQNQSQGRGRGGPSQRGGAGGDRGDRGRGGSRGRGRGRGRGGS